MSSSFKEPRRAAYDAYMQSDAWRRRRAEKIVLHVLEYGLLLCDICDALIDVDQGQRIVVHHVTYKRFGHEHPNDLQVVHDGKCHDRADEQRRRRDQWNESLARVIPRVHPDQLALFDYPDQG